MEQQLTNNTTPSTLWGGLVLLAAVAAPLGYWMLQQRRRRGGRRNLDQLTVQHSYTEFSDLVLPSLCSKEGMMYAGQLLSLLDIVGGTCAFKHCHGPIVTVTIDSVRFLAPAFAHDALIVSGRVNAVFRSSVEIEVTIEKENLFQDHETRSVCCKGTLVFVHLDPKSRRPLKCPPLKMTTDQEKARSQAALLRKQERAAERSGMVSSNGNNRSSKERILWWKQQWPKEEHDLNALQTFSKITFIETIPENAHKYTATTNKVIMPQHANTLQIAFGGQVMFWMEQAAALAAIRFARKNVITASLDRMSFDKQSKVGDLLSLEAIVTRAFDKSLEVKVRVHSYQAGTTDPVFTNAGFFTFTAVDETQRSVAVGTQVRPVTEETQKDFCEALRRREARLQEKSE